MRDKDSIQLEKSYRMVLESRAAGPESQVAGEDAKALAVEKTLIKAITEDLNATAAHLETIQPLIGTFEQGDMSEEFQGLIAAVSAVQAAVGSLQERLPQDQGEGEAGGEEFPVDSETGEGETDGEEFPPM